LPIGLYQRGGVALAFCQTGDPFVGPAEMYDDANGDLATSREIGVAIPASDR